jgi:hypothetical protein
MQNCFQVLAQPIVQFVFHECMSEFFFLMNPSIEAMAISNDFKHLVFESTSHFC